MHKQAGLDQSEGKEMVQGLKMSYAGLPCCASQCILGTENIAEPVGFGQNVNELRCDRTRCQQLVRMGTTHHTLLSYSSCCTEMAPWWRASHHHQQMITDADAPFLAQPQFTVCRSIKCTFKPVSCSPLALVKSSSSHDSTRPFLPCLNS